MSKELRYDGKVAIVTGAGGGLGRSHALLFASRGAKVVVNDLGGTFTGEGASQKAADAVVDEIKAAGGEAVANYDSVENGEAIAKTAIDAFGKVDILINNAGILRDVSFQKMTQQDWDLVYKVHVLGSMKVTKAVWDVMREQQYGRIVMTASAAGIYGNFGQANYSMAKLGLYGFAQTLAHEGRKRNIFVNTIAPIAGSRMTETVLPPNLIESLSPEYVSPLVAWLAHEECEDTGGLYEVGGGFFAKLRWERSTGKIYRTGRKITVEDVKSSWPDITQFDESTHPASVAESMQPIMENLERGPSKGGNQFIDVDEALGYEMPEERTKYDERDVALYALAVGAAKDPTNEKDLGLVYENWGAGFKVLPTFGVVPAIQVVFKLAKEGKQAKGMNYGFDRILHGEQYTEVLRPLPPHAKLVHKARIKDIWDKGKGAVVVTEFVSRDADTGEELIRNELSTFVRGAGGWGGDRGPSADVNVPPDRAPDTVVEERIPENAALLYRLTGDWNPLHADPGFAKAFGFDKPILHGLCTFGYAGRHVIQKHAPDGNPDYFKSIKVRFADSVFPGETLITEMWKDGKNKVVFRCKVKERDKVVISNAAIELYDQIPKPKPAKKPEAAAAAAPAASAEPTSADIFRAIGRYVQENADLAGSVKTVYKFALQSPASVWTINVKDAPGAAEGEAQAAQCTLELSDADFLAMCTGKADAMKLFTSGKLKISGDIMASQKLEFLKKVPPEYVMEEAKKRLGGSGPGVGTGSEQAQTAEASSADVFIAIKDHVERNPDLVNSVKTIFQFKLKNPDSVWTLNLKDAPGSVDQGETKAPECTLEIADADFMDMTSGKADAMKLFTTGKLKISGNVMASQKLDFLKKIDPEQAKAAVAKARGAGAQAPAAAAKAAPSKPAQAQAPAIFAALEKRLAEKPDLAKEVGAVVQVYVREPDAKYKLDLANSPPAVATGETDSATATLTLADADLAALAKGEVTARELFQRGKLRVDGDVSVAHRLGFMKGVI